jgi:hypothetical protein
LKWVPLQTEKGLFARQPGKFLNLWAGTSKEFAAVAITLAGEFNFALLHLRGEMYAGK